MATRAQEPAFGSFPARVLAGRRILLAEDELMVALDIEMALDDAGAEMVGPVDDLDAGLRLLRGETEIDAAILDVDLHGQDVFPIAEALQARQVPFLFHTGHGSREELGRRFGGVPVCIKPVLAEDMIEAVAELLG
ncbi:MAG: response regulator [Shimia sp.]